MYRPISTKQFIRDQKKAKRQNRNFAALEKVIMLLCRGELLPAKYCDHPLQGRWKEHRDCHVENDWVLIYKLDKVERTITFVRIGSHSELFK